MVIKKGQKIREKWSKIFENGYRKGQKIVKK